MSAIEKKPRPLPLRGASDFQPPRDNERGWIGTQTDNQCLRMSCPNTFSSHNQRRGASARLRCRREAREGGEVVTRDAQSPPIAPANKMGRGRLELVGGSTHPPIQIPADPAATATSDALSERPPWDGWSHGTYFCRRSCVCTGARISAPSCWGQERVCCRSARPNGDKWGPDVLKGGFATDTPIGLRITTGVDRTTGKGGRRA
jgi:hypothetical protein